MLKMDAQILIEELMACYLTNIHVFIKIKRNDSKAFHQFA